MSETGAVVAGRLLDAARNGEDGRLDLVGDPGGQMYLERGRVVLVESVLTPGLDLLVVRLAGPMSDSVEVPDGVAAAESRGALVARARELVESGAIRAHAVEVLRQHAVADAAAALLAADGTTLLGSRFVPGETAWTRLSRPLTPEELVAEAVRRRRLAVRLGVSVRTGSSPARVPRLPSPEVRLTAPQWLLVAHADGRRTVRDLAWMHGRGVYATALEVAVLQRLGLLALASPGSVSAGSDRPPDDARGLHHA